MLSIGSRAQVMHGNAKKTTGGLEKKDLKYNKYGRIVSKKKSLLGKKAIKYLEKAGYKAKKGQFGGDKNIENSITNNYNNNNNNIDLTYRYYHGFKDNILILTMILKLKMLISKKYARENSIPILYHTNIEDFRTNYISFSKINMRLGESTSLYAKNGFGFILKTDSEIKPFRNSRVAMLNEFVVRDKVDIDNLELVVDENIINNKICDIKINNLFYGVKGLEDKNYINYNIIKEQLNLLFPCNFSYREYDDNLNRLFDTLKATPTRTLNIGGISEGRRHILKDINNLINDIIHNHINKFFNEKLDINYNILTVIEYIRVIMNMYHTHTPIIIKKWD